MEDLRDFQDKLRSERDELEKQISSEKKELERKHRKEKHELKVKHDQLRMDLAQKQSFQREQRKIEKLSESHAKKRKHSSDNEDSSINDSQKGSALKLAKLEQLPFSDISNLDSFRAKIIATESSLEQTNTITQIIVQTSSPIIKDEPALNENIENQSITNRILNYEYSAETPDKLQLFLQNNDEISNIQLETNVNEQVLAKEEFDFWFSPFTGEYIDFNKNLDDIAEKKEQDKL